MKLSLVIPIYNEEQSLESVYQRLTKVNFQTEIEFIMVDDCSRDNSRRIIETIAAADPRVKAIYKPVNEGKSSALASGFKEVTGDIVIVQDADMEYNPHEIPSLVSMILDDKADVVYGSRFSSMSTQVVRFYHYLGNKFLTLLSNFFSDIRLSDMETCYKVFRAEIIKNIVIESKRFGFEPEVTAKISKLNIRLHELPISYQQRSYAEGKKIGVKDGFEAIWCIIKYNMLLSPSACYLSTMPEKYLNRKGLYSKN